MEEVESRKNADNTNTGARQLTDGVYYDRHESNINANIGPRQLTEGADCGDPDEGILYLSYEKARRFKESNHPRKVFVAHARDSIGNFTLPKLRYFRHGACCSAEVGRHPCCIPRNKENARLLFDQPSIKGEYDRYGDGVVLYFKVLAFFSIVFFILSLLAAPAMVMYFSGNQLSTSTDSISTASSVAASSASASSTSYVAYLSKFSLGNLGEATVVCSSGYSSSKSSFVSLSCPTGYVMLTTEAIYGAPSGECLCPAARVPNPTCPSSHSAISTSLSITVTPCDPPGAFCERSEKRPVKVPSGESFFAGACCASKVDGDGRPSFPDLDFKTDPAGCNANPITVNRIVRGKCIGRQSCTILLHPNQTQTWTSAITSSSSSSSLNIDNGAGNGLDDYVTVPECPPGKSYANGMCYDTLSSGGGLEKCIDRGPLSLPYAYRNATGFRLALFAKCFKSSVTLPTSLRGLGLPTSMTKTDISFIASLLSALSMVVLLLCYCLLADREGRVSTQYVTAADYTVMVTHLPPHKSLDELDLKLRQHFEKALKMRPMESSTLPEAARQSAKQTAKKLKEDGSSEDEIQTRSEDAALTACVRVADINFGLSNGESLAKFNKRGNLLRKLERLSREELILNTLKNDDAKLKKTRDELEKKKKELTAVDKELDDLYSGSNRSNMKASFAFVTFHQEEGALRALSAYPQSPLNWLFMPKELRVDEKTRIWVAPAPEPSDIRWENLSVPVFEHILRRLLTVIVLGCALLGAATLIFLATAKRRELESAYPVVTCSQLLALSGGLGGPLGLLSSESSSSLSSAMNVTKGRFVFNPLLDEGVANNHGGFSKIGVLADIYWSGLGLSSGNSGALGCYCMSVFTDRGLAAMRSESFPSLLPLNATLAQKSLASASREELCDEWVFAYAYASAFLYGAAFITIAINVALNQLVFIGVSFEKHNNATSELRARALYLFVLQFINTGLLVLLLNAQISSPTFSLLRSGENPDFNASWYSSVGTSIILTMLLNLVIPHLMPLALTLYASIRRCCDRDCSEKRTRTHQKIQAELNELHLGPEMQIDERYAQLYNTIFVCLAYSAGIPLLIPILFGYVVITLAVDTCLFSMSYRTPPQYSASLPRAFTSLLPFTAVLHLAFASWMLSNENIFPSQTALQDSIQLSNMFLLVGGSKGGFVYASRFITNFNPNDLHIGERLSTIQVLPLVVLLALLVAFLAISRLIVSSIFRPLLHLCSCAMQNTSKNAVADALKTKTSKDEENDDRMWCRIKRPKKEKGLSSYFRAIPPDDVDAVVRGTRMVKPHLLPFFEAAHKAHSKQGARDEITQLMAAYEDTESRLKDALANISRSELEAKEIRASIALVRENGATDATPQQIASNIDLNAMHVSARRMEAARERLVKKANRGIVAESDEKNDVNKQRVEGEEIEVDIVSETDTNVASAIAAATAQGGHTDVFQRSKSHRRGSKSIRAQYEEDEPSVEPVDTSQRLLVELDLRLQRARLAHARSSYANLAGLALLEDLKRRMRDIFARDESGGVGSPGSSGKQQYLQPQQRLKMAEKFIIGLYSYDLHDNREYASKWGLDTEIDDSLKRRLGELMT